MVRLNSMISHGTLDKKTRDKKRLSADVNDVCNAYSLESDNSIFQGEVFKISTIQHGDECDLKSA